MRVKTGTVRRRKHKKILKQARGFYAGRSKQFRKAKEQLEHSLVYAYRDRKAKKREFRKLWIIRINAAARMHELSYSRLIYGLKKAEVEIDRKVLAHLAFHDAEAFGKLCDLAKTQIQ